MDGVSAWAHEDVKTDEALRDLIKAQAYSAIKSASIRKERYPDGREFWTLTMWVEPKWETGVVEAEL